jgi:two-component system, OmpR family, sensor histidine kinase BaeS
MSGHAGPARQSRTDVARRWRELGLRWQLVLLNIGVVAATVGLILMLMHVASQQQWMTIMHSAGQPLNAVAGQRAYEKAVDGQVFPTIAAAAVVAIVLNFLVVTVAVRPLTAVRHAARQLALGASPATIETRRRDEIGAAAASVNALSRSLQQLEDLRRQVTNDVAHELRTPLHNLLGLIDGMRDGVLPASPATLERSRAELDRLITLVEDLRALADAQLARDRMNRVQLNLAALAREVMLGFDKTMAERRITSRVDGPEVDPVVEGDAGRLAQVLRNVVDNAVRYARTGTCVVATITELEGEGVRVAVSDEGLAISDESLAHIFERFFRVDLSRTRGSGGAGIGLAIARELVEAHGGQVGAWSDPRGVTVWFELPRLRGPRNPVKEDKPPSEATLPAHRGGGDRQARVG